MIWWLALSTGLVLLLALFVSGAPIFVAFLTVNLIGVALFFGESGFGLFANSIYATGTTAALATVALFIMMGEVLFRSGAMEAVLDSLDRLIGRVQGRQYVLGIALSAVLGALSGAAMGVAAMLGRSILPSMIERGYDTRLTIGTILGGASLAPVIPPSVLAIIIGTLAEVSIAGLLLAGIVPGLFLALLFLGYIMVRLRMQPGLAPRISEDALRKVTNRDRIMAFGRMLPCALVFFLVMGLIMLGIATPSEAAATGVVGAIVAAILYRGLNRRVLQDSLLSAMSTAAMLLLIMASSMMFSQLLSYTGATRELTEIATTLGLDPWLMFAVMMLFPFILFMFLDQIALMLVIIPIYQPLIASYGFDPIWFWTLFLINATVGGMTPPLGYMLFALKGASPETPIGVIFRSSWPFVGLMAFGVVVMAVFPQMVTALPAAFAGR